jgi:CheY-like chemotaxis protein
MDDLLDVSRVRTGRIELKREPLDASTAVRRALDAVHQLIEERGHELSISYGPGPLRVDADPTRLEQIIVNLLTNAAKYTEKGGHIWVDTARDGGEVLIKVRDNGHGMSPDVLPHIFEPFTQAERTLDRSQGGLGIGLTLVRNLVELHGGRVTAQSEGPDRGSEFVVRLPAPPQGTDEPEAPRAKQSADAGGMRVLVVDDSHQSAQTIKILLELSGHDVRAVHDGPAALAAYRTYRPDAVLLDVGLPGMSGYDVARQIRREQGDKKPLIVAVSGYGQEEDKRQAQESGCDFHMTKPVDPTKLVALIASAPSLVRASD